MRERMMIDVLSPGFVLYDFFDEKLVCIENDCRNDDCHILP